MIRKLKKLVWKNRKDFFKDTFEYREVCRYSIADFFYGDVKQIAEKNRVVVCSTHHFERYKIFGDNCFVILSAPGMKKEAKVVEDITPPTFFDPETLMI